jgi:hypothetical protein
MNAKKQIEYMKNDLIKAGFVMEIVEESEKATTYFFTQNETQWFETRKTFFISATKSDYSNSWRKYLAFTKSGFGINSVDKSNITYSEMWLQIQIVMNDAQFAKVGA